MRRPARKLLILVLMMAMPLCLAGFSDPNTGSAAHAGQWIATERVVDDGAASIDRMTISGPPEAPRGAHRPLADLSNRAQGRASNLLQVPTYNWCFGSAPTAAAMIAAWHDRTAYAEIYTGPTNGGLMPMDNSVWPDWVDNNGDSRHQCPLSATHNGLAGRSVNGHVDDYWDFLDQAGPDPFRGNWPEHAWADCTGDFMKSNRWFQQRSLNLDGETAFYFFPNGPALHASDMDGHAVRFYDGGYGLKQFYESRGYTATLMYNQYILGYNGNVQGFTYNQFKTEIDADRPVLIHLEGHTVAGVGYDDSAGQLIYINDCWDHAVHTMTWGSDYAGMAQMGVTIIHLGLTTLVELVNFKAIASAGQVNVSWETATELDNAGFHLWRCETKDGDYKKINKELIPAQGGASWGATYAVTDDRVTTGQVYFYKLEDVNMAGDGTLHGPVSARVRPMGGRSD